MRNVILFFLYLSLSSICLAQKQGNIWLFGAGDGLSFNVAPPIHISGNTGSYYFQLGTACISDANGSLLFYTDGANLYNRQNKPMLNGIGIGGRTSSQQNSIIVPLPGSDSLFYVFTSDDGNEYFIKKSPLGYNYSVVNMCLDWQNPESGGLGGIIAGKKNIHLVDSGTEKLCAASDGVNGYWILGHKMLSDTFVAWHLTSAGLSATVTTSIAPIIGKILPSGHVTGIWGQMKFNPSGTKVGVVNKFGKTSPTLDLYDFNPISGKLSNHCQTILMDDTTAYSLGLEFSPDGTKLYVSVMGTKINQILQYKLSANCSNIGSSVDTISSAPNTMYGIQAAPDGNLYLGIKNSRNNLRMDRILNPNAIRPLLQYDSAFMNLNDGFPNSIIPEPPSFVAGFRYKNGVCHCPAPVSVPSASSLKEITVTPNPANTHIRLTLNSQQYGSGLTLKITDIRGRVLYNQPASQTEIELINYPEGLYFYQIAHQQTILKQGKFSVVH
ncbi:MAG: T9SS type A sorting domain-containing protein [Bacteroidetes bacterium]|nr:T9SS type A sorting domain-containing protein [Bacteroidota bacterium]